VYISTLGGVTYQSPSANVLNGMASVAVPANALPVGNRQLAVNYSGDEYYESQSTYIMVSVESTGSVAPTIELSPNNTKVSGDPFNLDVTIHGEKGAPTPTGYVTATAPYSASTTLPLENGEAVFPFSVIPGVTDSIAIAYFGDSYYAAASATDSVTIPSGKSVSSMGVLPAQSSINVKQTLKVKITLYPDDGVTFYPTGTVAISCGNYKSGATKLVNSSATLTIPANALPVGPDWLTVSYSGDASYFPGNSSAFVNVLGTAPAIRRLAPAF